MEPRQKYQRMDLDGEGDNEIRPKKPTMRSDNYPYEDEAYEEAVLTLYDPETGVNMLDDTLETDRYDISHYAMDDIHPYRDEQKYLEDLKNFTELDEEQNELLDEDNETKPLLEDAKDDI